jgi:hypothetical protein
MERRGHHGRRAYQRIYIIGYIWPNNIKVRCTSCQKGVMLMLFYRETQIVTFGRMNASNAHLSNQIGIRI